MSRVRRRILNGRHGRWAPAAAYLLVTVAAVTALALTSKHSTDQLRTSQVQACERGNRLRTELNRNLEAGAVRSDVLIGFLQAAQRVRRAAYEQDHRATDLAAVSQYGELIERVSHAPDAEPIPLVNCRAAVR